MDDRKAAAQALAHAILRGQLQTRGIMSRSALAIGSRARWLKSFCKRLLEHFREGSRPGGFRVARFIFDDAGFRRAWKNKPWIAWQELGLRARMCPAAGSPRSWKVLPILTEADLSRRLMLTPGELAWFADRRSQEQRLPTGPLRHYHYRWQQKRDGSCRLIESPKQRLKGIQRYLLKEILNCIPPHHAAHGFRSGRSIKSFVGPHIGKHLVLKLDLKNFFPSVTKCRVSAIFLTAGYPEKAASLLASLCVNGVPSDVIRSMPDLDPHRRYSMRKLYQRPHLPQGAPTSPALANLVAYRLDCRLAGLASATGSAYTRYADDLVFSGDASFARMAGRLYIQACAIALEEGFEVHTRKTRMMRAAQSQCAAGIVINQRTNLARSKYDELKSILHHCIVGDPAQQNRKGVPNFRAHLDGRISYLEMLNPARGKKLREQFNRIRWPAIP